MQHASVLSTTHLQFGFKPNHSTSQCTYVVNEVIDFYAQRNSPVYVTLLDASKAFDKVHFVKLFKLLIDRGLCSAVTLLLLSMYTCQSLVVNWQGVRSDSFECKNGVKQGGVLSPVLFCVYIEKLLLQLEQRGVGCHIGQVFAGAVAYADDVTLMAPCLSAMQKLLDVCTHYANDFNLQFNASKSQAMIFNAHDYCDLNHHLSLCNTPIAFVDSAVHLGHYIGSDAPKKNMEKAIRDITIRVNSIYSNYHFVSSDITHVLFNSYCTSFYGFQFFDLSVCGLHALNISWKRCIRKIFKLPPRTRSKYVYCLSDKPEPRIELLYRLANFWARCCTSTNLLLRTCTQISQTGFSVVSNNVRELFAYCKINESLFHVYVENGLSVSQIVKNIWLEGLSPDVQAAADLIKELCLIRDGNLFSHLNYVEVMELLVAVCLD